MPYDPVIQADHSFNPEYFDPVFRQVCCGWIPDLSRDWGIEYDLEGLAPVTQSWVVPRHELLPLALRQMLSWNREKYFTYYQFMDWEDTSSFPQYHDRPLVPVSARLTPLPTNYSPAFLSGQFFTDFSRKIATGADTCGTCDYNVFPSIYTDKYRLDVQFARDEFTNRFGIKYAKVEIEPSIRLESITGASMGVVKIKSDGSPDINLEATNRAVEPLTTGFPSREPQILIKVTYPWVSMRKIGNASPSILNAGPIGFIGNVTNDPPPAGTMPTGQLLGMVNDAPFLGFPRGRVLYQSASLVEKVSPVTGRLGYQVTHDFLCLTTCEWNMTRLKKAIGETDVAFATDTDQKTALWPYGFIVATDATGAVILKSNPPLATSPIFPYAYANLTKLVYYGGTEDPEPNDEA